MWTVAFWKNAGERAIKTFAQAFGAAVGSDVIGVTDLDWATVASVSLMAAILSVMFSIANPDYIASGPADGVAPAPEYDETAERMYDITDPELD